MSLMPTALKPNDRMLRQFAGLWIVFFGLAAIVQGTWSSRQTLAVALGALALTIGPIGLAWPRLIKPIFIGWMVLAYPIGWVVSHLVLALLFYLVFTPVSWAFKIAGRDELRLKSRQQVVTYWQQKPQVLDKSQYLRQF